MQIYIFKRIMRVMRITAFFMLAGALTAGAAGISQTVTMDLKNVPVQRVFKEVFRQTGISIVYSEAMFDDKQKVSIKVKDAKVDDVLERCLNGLSLDFVIKDNSVVIEKRQVSL